jgi:hypothetical protein
MRSDAAAITGFHTSLDITKANDITSCLRQAI